MGSTSSLSTIDLSKYLTYTIMWLIGELMDQLNEKFEIKFKSPINLGSNINR
jgi:hypothetical protein